MKSHLRCERMLAERISAPLHFRSYAMGKEKWGWKITGKSKVTSRQSKQKEHLIAEPPSFTARLPRLNNVATGAANSAPIQQKQITTLFLERTRWRDSSATAMRGDDGHDRAAAFVFVPTSSLKTKNWSPRSVGEPVPIAATIAEDAPCRNDKSFSSQCSPAHMMTIAVNSSLSQSSAVVAG